MLSLYKVNPLLASVVVPQQQVAPCQRDFALVVSVNVHAYTKHSWDHELMTCRMYEGIIVLQYIDLQTVIVYQYQTRQVQAWMCTLCKPCQIDPNRWLSAS